MLKRKGLNRIKVKIGIIIIDRYVLDFWRIENVIEKLRVCLGKF